MGAFSRAAALAGALAALAACSGGEVGGGGSDGDPPPGPPGDRVVELKWAANRERGVNSPGGGYRVEISGRPTIDVPYITGSFAPTSVTTTLYTGSYTFTVRAYATLDSNGEASGTVSAPSQPRTIAVP